MYGGMLEPGVIGGVGLPGNGDGWLYILWFCWKKKTKSKKSPRSCCTLKLHHTHVVRNTHESGALHQDKIPSRPHERNTTTNGSGLYRVGLLRLGHAVAAVRGSAGRAVHVVVGAAGMHHAGVMLPAVRVVPGAAHAVRRTLRRTAVGVGRSLATLRGVGGRRKGLLLRRVAGLAAGVLAACCTVLTRVAVLHIKVVQGYFPNLHM